MTATTPLSKYFYGLFGIGGGLLSNTITKTTSYTIDSGSLPDHVILCNFSVAGSVTLPVPTAGRTLTIKDISGSAGTNNITVSHHSSELIDGASSYIILTNYGAVNLVSDGANWYIETSH